MTFAERLKNLRKQAGFSQEKLAEKLGVSRQAVTKWETEAGVPDMENVLAISTLFGVSLDELLSGEKNTEPKSEYLFESMTDYDIDHAKRYDIKLGGAKQVRLIGSDAEKLHVTLASDQLSSLQSDCKVKIDDGRDRLDLELSRKNGMTEAMAKEALFVTILLPKNYIHQVELAVHAESIVLENLSCEQIELDVKSQTLSVSRVEGTVEVNCNQDMEVTCTQLKGSIELNQLSATSKLTLPAGYSFRTSVKGIGNSVSYRQNGKPCDDRSDENAENCVKLNGMKSELIIDLKD